MLVDLISIWSSQSEYSLVGRIGAGEFVSADEITRSDNRQRAIGNTQLGLFVVCSISFLAWFVQAYRNAETLGAEGIRFSSGWAIGAWFVPILNIFRPKQITDDIWRAGAPDVPLARQREWAALNPPRLLLAWWLAFLVSGWAASLTRLYADAETATEIQKLDRVYMISDSLDVVAAVLAIVVVTVITRRLEARFERARAATVEPVVV